MLEHVNQTLIVMASGKLVLQKYICRCSLSLVQDIFANVLNVLDVSAAAASEDVDPGHLLSEAGHQSSELFSVTLVQGLGGLELGVAPSGRVGLEASEPGFPGPTLVYKVKHHVCR